MKYIWSILLMSMTSSLVWSESEVTPAQQCPGESFEDLHDRVHVSPCGKTRCKLRKNTNATVLFKFKPKKEIKTLINEVYADVSGLALPFIGVTGKEACGHVVGADGQPAACPLQAGQEYAYTNVFHIEPYYPSVAVHVHWSLTDGHDTVMCFELPAVIAGPKKD